MLVWLLPLAPHATLETRLTPPSLVRISFLYVHASKSSQRAVTRCTLGYWLPQGEAPKLPLSAWFTLGRWKERLRRLHGSIKSVFTIAKCKRNIPDWTLPAFKEEVRVGSYSLV